MSAVGKLKLELQLVARSNIQEEPSPYYPPRARWYSPLLSLGSTIRRRIGLDRIHLPAEVTVGGLIGSFFIPGLGVYLRGPRIWGQAAFAGWGFVCVLFIVWFGHTAGHFAFGLLLAIHTIGFMHYCHPLLRQAELRSRLLFTLLALLAISLLIYVPIRRVIQQHWLTPLRVNGHVVVVQTQFSAEAIQRGDWSAYKLEGSGMWEEAVRLRSGMGLGPVPAMAGDRVEFSTNNFTVNSVAQPRLPHMPDSGAVTVPGKNWFVWPNFDISGGHGNVGENNISAAMLQMATISQAQFVGKPFKRWLWRRQVLS